MDMQLDLGLGRVGYDNTSNCHKESTPNIKQVNVDKLIDVDSYVDLSWLAVKNLTVDLVGVQETGNWHYFASKRYTTLDIVRLEIHYL